MEAVWRWSEETTPWHNQKTDSSLYFVTWLPEKCFRTWYNEASANLLPIITDSNLRIYHIWVKQDMYTESALEMYGILLNILRHCQKQTILRDEWWIREDLEGRCRGLTVKSSYTCNRPWRPTGLWDVEAPTFSLDCRLTYGGKVVSFTHLLPFTPPPPRKIPDTHFCYRLSRPQVHNVTGRIR
jgi:hypothetical protein